MTAPVVPRSQSEQNRVNEKMQAMEAITQAEQRNTRAGKKEGQTVTTYKPEQVPQSRHSDKKIDVNIKDFEPFE